LRVALAGRHLVDHLPQVVVDRIAGEQAGVELALDLVGELCARAKSVRRYAF